MKLNKEGKQEMLIKEKEDDNFGERYNDLRGMGVDAISIL